MLYRQELNESDFSFLLLKYKKTFFPLLYVFYRITLINEGGREEITQQQQYL